MGQVVSSINEGDVQTEQSEQITTDGKGDLIINESLPLKSLLCYREKGVSLDLSTQCQQPKFTDKSEQPKGDSVVSDEISFGQTLKKYKHQKCPRSQKTVHFKQHELKESRSTRSRRITMDMLDEQF